MPIKTAFNKSLLNCQPILSSSSRVVSTLYDKDDGYAGVDVGFACLIEKQKQQKSNSNDSVSLVGVSDFIGSEKFSIDPQRPEIILVSKLFSGNEQSNRDFLRLKNFEASLDEADTKTIFDSLFQDQDLSKKIEKRIEVDLQNREQVLKILESVSQISLSVNNFRDSTNFIGDNLRIHSTAASQRRKIIKRFSEDPEGSLMTLKRTFLGLNENSPVTNTSLLQLLMISLLLPGSIKFSSPSSQVQGSKFILPSISSDSASDFLQILSTKDVSNSRDFIDLESILPKDSYARLSLIANCLSYELTTTAGLALSERSSIFDILDQNIGPVSDIIRSNTSQNKITSNLKIGITLPFEVRSQTIDGVTHKSSIETFIDPIISSGNLQFKDLESFSKSVSTNFGSYINLIGKVRGIEKNSSISGAELIAMVCERVLAGTKTLRTQSPDAKEAIQLAYLAEISKNHTINGVKSRFEIFENTFLKKKQNNVLTIKLQNLTNNSVGSKSIFSKTQDLISAMAEAIKNEPAQEMKKQQINKSNVLSTRSSLQPLLSNNQSISKMSKIIPSSQRREKNETVRSILTQLSALSIESVFSMGKNSTSIQTGTVAESFNIQDSKVSSLGTTDSVLSIFGIKIDEIYNKKYSNSFDIVSENPIADITSAGVPSNQLKKDSKDYHFLAYSSLPVKNRKMKIYSKREINSLGSKDDNLFTSMGLKTFNAFIENTASPEKEKNTQTLAERTKNISTTLIKTGAQSIKKKGGTITPSIFGTSLTVDGSNEYFKLMSSNRKKSIERQQRKKDYVDPRSIERIDTIDEVSNIIDSVKLIEKKQFINSQTVSNIDFDVESRKKKVSTPSESSSNAKNIDEKYINSFNCLLDSINDDSNSSVYPAQIKSVLQNFGKDGTVTSQMNSLYNILSKKVDEISGRDSLLDNNGTLNYSLDSQKIKFLIFQMFSSILSMIESSRSYKTTISTIPTFDEGYFVISKINYSNLNIEFDSLDNISRSIGTSSEIVSSRNISSSFSKVIRAIAYCSISDDLFIERFFVAKSFLDLYTNSVAEITSISSNKNIQDSIATIKKNEEVSVLQNLTKETVSAKQLQYTKNFLEPISVRYSSRMCRIYSNILSSLLGKVDFRNFDCIAIGVPTTAVENLRRTESSGYTDFKSGNKEYLEFEIAKRNVQFSDLVEKPSKVRFCQFFEVIPQFTGALDLKSAVNDFTYICYEDGSWNTKSISESVEFISKITSLDYIDSISIVMNHIVDSICKLTLFGSTGISSDELLSQITGGNISKEGFTLLNSIINSSSVSLFLPTGDMKTLDFLKMNEDGTYAIKKYSELGSAIDKTDQPTHRLLCSFLGDSMFNSEFILKNVARTFPFERIYFVTLSKNDFVIDKISSYSTEPGRAAVNGLTRSSMIIDDGTEIRFVDSSNLNRLDSSEINIKLTLVTN